MPKYLYLIEQHNAGAFETFYGAVVCAEHDDAAKRMHPDTDYQYDEEAAKFFRIHPEHGGKAFDDTTWPDTLSEITVKRLGVADDSVPVGVVFTAYHNA